MNHSFVPLRRSLIGWRPFRGVRLGTIGLHWKAIFISFCCMSTLFLLFSVFKLEKIISRLSSKLEPHHLETAHTNQCFRKYAINGKNVDSGYLRHVHEVFQRLLYCRVNVSDDWDVLWSHSYPFRTLKSRLSRMRMGQMINHFPGSGYITNKMNLATSDFIFVPKAFQLPKEVEKFKQYAKKNKNKYFVQKSNNHRGIKILPVSELDLSKNNSFVQEFIMNPLLIDGHKFDIGVYTIITSIEPLRVYMYREALFRFCPIKYHPFDPGIVDKYVVRDDYLPIWKMNSLKRYYNSLGLGMRDSFDAWYDYNRGSGASKRIWIQMESAIRRMLLMKEHFLLSSKKKFMQNIVSKPRNMHPNFFYELMRFDFIIDEEGEVYMMEANMSPNLSSAHFPPNALLYEHVILNVFSLVGITNIPFASEVANDDDKISSKELSVYPLLCSSSMCMSNSKNQMTENFCKRNRRCEACYHCMTEKQKVAAKYAYLEHVQRLDTVRIFPPTHRPTNNSASVLFNETLFSYDIRQLNVFDSFMVKWIRGKCEMDNRFCY